MLGKGKVGDIAVSGDFTQTIHIFANGVTNMIRRLGASAASSTSKLGGGCRAEIC